MYITSISFSYLFLIISLISLIFFAYFTFIVTKTRETSSDRQKIVGNMKDPTAWRARNKNSSILSIIITAVSLGLFIYLKFFLASILISIVYLFIIIAAIVVSLGILLGFSKKKAKSH